MDDSIEIQTRQLVTSQSQSPTSQPRVTLLVGCNLKWSDCQSLMARPGWRRGRIVITTVPRMKIDAETIIPTPATLVLPDTGRNGVTCPVAIAVIITVQHQLRDDPMTEAGSGVQHLARQLLQVLVTVIQRDNRGHCGGLVPRQGMRFNGPAGSLVIPVKARDLQPW